MYKLLVSGQTYLTYIDLLVSTVLFYCLKYNRVLGRQLLPVQESGYELIEREMSRPNTTSSMGLMDVTDQDLSGSQDSQG